MVPSSIPSGKTGDGGDLYLRQINCNRCEHEILKRGLEGVVLLQEMVITFTIHELHSVALY